MRTQKNFVGNLESSFLSCEKDTELILKKLLVDSNPYSNELKRLLLINTKDCLDDRTNQAYKEKINSFNVASLMDKGYIKLKPQIKLGENQEVMNYIIISYDNFTPSSNQHYRDCVVEIDIICNNDCWDLGNYRVRPIKIMGYIDGILNNAKLTGIGKLNFLGANELVLNEDFSGYCLMYRAVHGDDDTIPPEE